VHSCGVVHRDLKPRNIILREDGYPCILDFGLAKVPGESVSAVGDMVGTLGYMSPEQLQANGIPLDRRADVFALGVILYELLTLSLPFTGELPEILHATCFEEPAPPSARVAGTPRELDDICEQAMQKDPQRRFQRAADFAAALRSFLRAPARWWLAWSAH
jgi:serine/threonine protein kinase